MGTKSRAAISEFQTSIGMKSDGRAGQRVLQALRAATAK
ncbi:MAG: peptidoglycan-binding protein [Zwartia sp.]